MVDEDLILKCQTLSCSLSWNRDPATGQIFIRIGTPLGSGSTVASRMLGGQRSKGEFHELPPRSRRGLPRIGPWREH